MRLVAGVCIVGAVVLLSGCAATAAAPTVTVTVTATETVTPTPEPKPVTLNDVVCPIWAQIDIPEVDVPIEIYMEHATRDLQARTLKNVIANAVDDVKAALPQVTDQSNVPMYEYSLDQMNKFLGEYVRIYRAAIKSAIKDEQITVRENDEIAGYGRKMIELVSDPLDSYGNCV